MPAHNTNEVFDIEFEYQAHGTAEVMLKQNPEYVFQSQARIARDKEAHTKETQEYLQTNNKVNRYSLHLYKTLKLSSTENLEYFCALGERVVHITPRGFVTPYSISLTPHSWSDVTRDLGHRGVEPADRCTTQSIAAVCSTQMHSIETLRKRIDCEQESMCNKHNIQMTHCLFETNSQSNKIMRREVYNYTDLLYGMLRRIPRNKDAQYTLGFRSFNANTLSANVSYTKPQLVMVTAKPKEIKDMSAARLSPDRCMFVTAHRSANRTVSMFNYSVYNSDDIETALYARFSAFVGFGSVLNYEMEQLRAQLQGVYVNDMKLQQYLYDANITVYQDARGSSMSFVSEQALIEEKYMNILRKCNLLYNTIHWMGLDAFYRNYGVDKVMLYVHSAHVSARVTDMCYVTSLGNIFDEMHDTLSQAQQYFALLETRALDKEQQKSAKRVDTQSVNLDLRKHFWRAAESPISVMRESIRLALSAPVEILHSYVQHAIKDSLNIHDTAYMGIAAMRKCAQIAIAQTNHDKCEECLDAFRMLASQINKEAISLEKKIYVATSIACVDTEVFAAHKQLHELELNSEEQVASMTAAKDYSACYRYRMSSDCTASELLQMTKDLEKTILASKCTHLLRLQQQLQQQLSMKSPLYIAILQEAAAKDMYSKYAHCRVTQECFMHMYKLDKDDAVSIQSTVEYSGIRSLPTLPKTPSLQTTTTAENALRYMLASIKPPATYKDPEYATIDEVDNAIGGEDACAIVDAEPLYAVPHKLKKQTVNTKQQTTEDNVHDTQTSDNTVAVVDKIEQLDYNEYGISFTDQLIDILGIGCYAGEHALRAIHRIDRYRQQHTIQPACPSFTEELLRELQDLDTKCLTIVEQARGKAHETHMKNSFDAMIRLYRAEYGKEYTVIELVRTQAHDLYDTGAIYTTSFDNMNNIKKLITSTVSDADNILQELETIESYSHSIENVTQLYLYNTTICNAIAAACKNGNKHDILFDIYHVLIPTIAETYTAIAKRFLQRQMGEDQTTKMISVCSMLDDTAFFAFYARLFLLGQYRHSTKIEDVVTIFYNTTQFLW